MLAFSSDMIQNSHSPNLTESHCAEAGYEICEKVDAQAISEEDRVTHRAIGFGLRLRLF